MMFAATVLRGQDDQSDSAIAVSSTQALPEVSIQAFQLNRAADRIPAAVGVLDSPALQRFGTAGIVSAVNTIPGVRMEERSPGSYRLAIRGSSLRAPFGVRNVKVYYNGIPLTDPGGNTYLNQIGYYNISGIELIKGPGSSLYGAGTGGVALISSLPQRVAGGIAVEATAGSYGLYNVAAEARSADSSGRLASVFRYQHLQSDGYREQTAMRRDVLSWDGRAQLSSGLAIAGHFYYTDLLYQTPGALTKAEFDANPRGARPRAGTSPGAREAGAEIRQKAFLAGVSVDYKLAAHWRYTATFYAAQTLFENPTIRNFSRSTEPQGGGRLSINYGKAGLLITGGIELQAANNSVQTYSNRLTSADTLQSDDALGLRNGFAFLQGSYELRRWMFTGGLSVNAFRLRYQRLNSGGPETVRDINNTAAPRAALSYRLTQSTTAYVSLARGFSPPSSAELSPSGGVLNPGLQPEAGWNYELGLHHNGRLSCNAAIYYFQLRQAIVQRRDAAGGDFYINSGGTRQLGVELDGRYRLDKSWAFSAAYSYQHFRYADFAQVDQDLSGNAMPGIAPHSGFAAIDWTSGFGLYVRISGSAVDFMYLDDGNSTTQAGYALLSARAGYRFHTARYGFEIFGGGDNLTDVKYSAGPDLNGFGGRYYNAAPGASFYAGLRLDRTNR
jgi:iron complex outermembrane receptor protein